jgi:putative ABC transport system substrate-binding protein
MRRLALSAFILLLAIAPAAWAGSIALALSDDSGPYAEFSATLSDALQGSNWSVKRSGRPEAVGLPAPRADLIVTAGSEALRKVLASGTTLPVIATLLPRQSYERIMAEAGRPRSRVTAITLDQPASRQASFLRHLLPGQKRIGLLLSEETQGAVGQFRQSFSAVGLTLDSENSEDNTASLLAALNGLLPRINVLLAIPDSTIYKRDNIKAILVTSYRHQRPVVAYSAAFVKAGALAALYSTPAQIASQTAELVVGPAPLPAGAIAPALFAISVNQNVAQALGLAIPDEITIRQGMLAERESR